MHHRNSSKISKLYFLPSLITNQGLFGEECTNRREENLFVSPFEFSEFSDEFFFETIPSQEGFNKFTFLLQPSDAKLLISDTAEWATIIAVNICKVRGLKSA